MPVYLIHFDRPLHHARHYIGFCFESTAARLARHMAGNGAKILRALNAAGIAYRIVRTWDEGDKVLERKLKGRKNAKRLCPVCKGQ
jgi:hypothetical protein